MLWTSPENQLQYLVLWALIMSAGKDYLSKEDYNNKSIDTLELIMIDKDKIFPGGPTCAVDGKTLPHLLRDHKVEISPKINLPIHSNTVVTMWIGTSDISESNLGGSW